jgi:hypothetical protein
MTIDDLYTKIWKGLKKYGLKSKAQWQMMLIQENGEWLRPTIEVIKLTNKTKLYLWNEPYDYSVRVEKVRRITAYLGISEWKHTVRIYRIHFLRGKKEFQTETIYVCHHVAEYYFDEEVRFTGVDELRIHGNGRRDFRELVERVHVSRCAQERLREWLRDAKRFEALWENNQDCSVFNQGLKVAYDASDTENELSESEEEEEEEEWY